MNATTEQNSTHTPGPWKASETYPVGAWCVHAKGIPWQLAYLARSSQIEWPLEANARLIAAAPELLDALIAADGLLRELGHSLPQVKAVLAKAAQS